MAGNSVNGAQAINRSHFCFSDLVAELPFILMHPKPDDDEPVIGDRSPGRTIANLDKLHAGAGGAGSGGGGTGDLNKNSTNRGGEAGKEDGPNLIQLDG